MTETIADVTPDTGTARAAVVPRMRVVLALVQREFWEHRALWIVPLVVGALLVCLAAVAKFGGGGYDRMQFGPFNSNSDGSSVVDAHAIGVAVASIQQALLVVPFFMSTAVMLWFYLLSSLYDERKDRSILFWKSLPLSDTATVLSKLLVAAVVVPLGVYLVWILTHLLCVAALRARLALGLAAAPFTWDTIAWLKVNALMLTTVVMSSLWYAPIAAYLVLVSAWARRNPFLWAVLPPLLLAVVERVAFGTTYLGHLFGYRLALWRSLGPDDGTFNAAMLQTPFGKLPSIPTAFDLLDYRGLFANVDLWLGVVVAVVLVYVAIRLRRYRDDT
jgi:ABC-2 type transport system permease protein